MFPKATNKSFMNYLSLPYVACGSGSAKTNSKSGSLGLKRLLLCPGTPIGRLAFPGFDRNVWRNDVRCYLSVGIRENILPRKELVRVRHEFRIRAGAQLMKVHALTLSLDRHAEGIEAVEEPVHAGSQGLDKPQQRGHANQLSQPLAGSDSIQCRGKRISRNIQNRPLELAEHAQREETPNTPPGMHGNT